MTKTTILQPSPDIHLVNKEDKQFILVGTAHISQKSIDAVRQAIEEYKPDCLCIEIDQKRLTSLTEEKKWEDLNIRQVIKEKKHSILILQLLLSAYQQKMGKKLGVSPGAEMLTAYQLGVEKEIPLVLADRDANITLRRLWRKASFLKKISLFGGVLGSVFDKQKITEESLQKMRENDTISMMIEEIGESFPFIKEVLINERDDYLSEKIKTANGTKILSVVGAGHVPGILKYLTEEKKVVLSDLEKIPKKSFTAKYGFWAITLLLISVFIFIGIEKGVDSAKETILFWFLSNGILSGLGAIIALANPLVIILAFISSPFTSLTPVIGVGYLCGILQAILSPPKVSDLKKIKEDATKPLRWWKNKALKIFLVLFLTSLGSFAGSILGSSKIFLESVKSIKQLFS